VNLVAGAGTVMMRKTSGMPAVLAACDAAFCDSEGPANVFVDLVFMVDGDQIEASFMQEYLCAE